MAEENFSEKTERPTPRKLEESRRDGNVPRSKEIPSAFIMLAGAFALSVMTPAMGQKLATYQRDMLGWIGRDPEGIRDAMSILALTGDVLVDTLAPTLLALAAVSLLVGLVQGQWTFSTKPIEPNPNHLNPVEGFKKIFGIRAIVNLIKQVLRLALVGAVAYWVGTGIWEEIMGLSGASPAAVVDATRRLTLKLLGTMGAAYLAIAAADYGFEFWDSHKKLMMSLEEVKREMKDSDGDPLMKQKIRETMRKISMGKMMRDIPKSDVVIVNPTHRAVALRYRPEEAPEPMVLAMGERKLALRIREIAESHGIAIVEDRALAKALIRTATVGRPIPPEVYSAVAEVLAHLFRAKYRASSPGARPRRPI